MPTLTQSRGVYVDNSLSTFQLVVLRLLCVTVRMVATIPGVHAPQNLTVALRGIEDDCQMGKFRTL